MIYKLVGEYRYPIRLRGWYLARILPPKTKTSYILDIGCGEGQTSFFLAKKYPKARVLGVDISSNKIDHCLRIARGSNFDNMSFEAKDFLKSTLEEEHFDLITCFEVLEHIEDYQRAISIMIKYLKPGGHLIIHTPAAGRFQSSTFGIRRFFRRPANGTHEKGQYHVS